MRSIIVSSGMLGMTLTLAGELLDRPTYELVVSDPHEALAAPSVDPNQVVASACVRCHSEPRLRGNLSLRDFDIATAPENAEVVERMIRKLRAGMMPPPGARARGGHAAAARRGAGEHARCRGTAQPEPWASDVSALESS